MDPRCENMITELRARPVLQARRREEQGVIDGARSVQDAYEGDHTGMMCHSDTQATAMAMRVGRITVLRNFH